MGDDKLDLLQGTLDLMVLRTLAALGPMHGYGLARRIEQASGNALLLNQGTIYAALVRLQQRGWIAAEWGTSDANRKAKFYSLTKRGLRALEAETTSWTRLSRRDVAHPGRVAGADVMALDELRRALARGMGAGHRPHARRRVSTTSWRRTWRWPKPTW